VPTPSPLLVGSKGCPSCDGPPLSMGLEMQENDGHKFDSRDYSMVVKLRGVAPKPWRWEIYCAGQSRPIATSPEFFETATRAWRDGKTALQQLLARKQVA